MLLLYIWRLHLTLALHQCELILNVIMINNIYYVKRTCASINLPEELICKATLLKVSIKLFNHLISCDVVDLACYNFPLLFYFSNGGHIKCGEALLLHFIPYHIDFLTVIYI